MKYISSQENGIFKEDYLMKIIATNNAPAAIGPYSQGHRIRQFRLLLRPDSCKSRRRYDP